MINVFLLLKNRLSRMISSSTLFLMLELVLSGLNYINFFEFR